MKFNRIWWFLPLVLIPMTNQCRHEPEAASKEYHEALEPYVHFLENSHMSPVDYVMNLFQKHDIVILCERAHPEATQYEFLFTLVSDPRFITEVGHIFTELGTITQQDHIDRYLKSEDISEQEAEKALLSVYRNVTFHPVWNNLNFYAFLKKVRHLNLSLTGEKKIDVRFSDIPFNWEGMTREEYQEFQDTLPQRDRIMADQIIATFSEIQKSQQPRKKALVIMNYRHAFNDRFEKPGGKKGENVGRYIFEAFPESTANVMINSVRIMLGSTDEDVIMAPIKDGKWDAAFAVTGNPSLGFDFLSSPFGRDEFDFFPVRMEGQTYQDVFTGFIFYKPLEEHKYFYGIPSLFADGFDDVAVTRSIQTGMTLQAAKQHVDEIRHMENSSYDNMEEMQKIILKWIDGAERR